MHGIQMGHDDQRDWPDKSKDAIIAQQRSDIEALVRFVTDVFDEHCIQDEAYVENSRDAIQPIIERYRTESEDK